MELSGQGEFYLAGDGDGDAICRELSGLLAAAGAQDHGVYPSGRLATFYFSGVRGEDFDAALDAFAQKYANDTGVFVTLDSSDGTGGDVFYGSPMQKAVGEVAAIEVQIEELRQRWRVLRSQIRAMEQEGK